MRTPRVGEKVKIIKSTDASLIGKEAIIRKINWLTVKLKADGVYSLVETITENIEYLEPAQLSGEEKKQILLRALKPEVFADSKAVIRELAIFKKLFDKISDVDFWLIFNPDYKANSLAWYLGDGKHDLEKFFNAFNLDFKLKTCNIGKTKIGEDAVIDKKPSLRQWLK